MSAARDNPARRFFEARNVAVVGASRSPGEADRMIVECGVSVLLDAHRGGPAGDRCAVRDLLVRLAALADVGTGIREVEINPLIVGDEGAGATAVDALVTMERAPDPEASA